MAVYFNELVTVDQHWVRRKWWFSELILGVGASL